MSHPAICSGDGSGLPSVCPAAVERGVSVFCRRGSDVEAGCVECGGGAVTAKIGEGSVHRQSPTAIYQLSGRRAQAFPAELRQGGCYSCSRGCTPSFAPIFRPSCQRISSRVTSPAASDARRRAAMIEQSALFHYHGPEPGQRPRACVIGMACATLAPWFE